MKNELKLSKNEIISDLEKQIEYFTKQAKKHDEIAKKTYDDHVEAIKEAERYRVYIKAIERHIKYVKESEP